jgi:tetratricopeptide (TPR) repeat protein
LEQRALCQHGKGDEKAALKDFEAAAELEPKNARIQFFIGQSNLTLKNKKKAKAAFEKAASLGAGTPVEKAAKAEIAKL